MTHSVRTLMLERLHRFIFENPWTDQGTRTKEGLHCSPLSPEAHSFSLSSAITRTSNGWISARKGNEEEFDTWDQSIYLALEDQIIPRTREDALSVIKRAIALENENVQAS